MDGLIVDLKRAARCLREQSLDVELPLSWVAVMDERAVTLAKSDKSKGKSKSKQRLVAGSDGGAVRPTAGPSAQTEPPLAISEPTDESDDGTPPLAADQIPPTAEGREAK